MGFTVSMLSTNHKLIRKSTKGMRTGFGFKMAINKFRRGMAYSHLDTRTHSRFYSKHYCKNISLSVSSIGLNYSRLVDIISSSEVSSLLDRKSLSTLASTEDLVFSNLCIGGLFYKNNI